MPTKREMMKQEKISKFQKNKPRFQDKFFSKFQSFILASLFIIFVPHLAVVCFHCFSFALVCMLRGSCVVCLMGLWCIEEFE